MTILETDNDVAALETGRFAEEVGNDRGLSQFSVFEGDLVNRLFAHIGIGSKSVISLLCRMMVIIGITWAPMAVVSAHSVHAARPPAAENFFYDFAAYAQFFLGIPLFIIAERVVSVSLMQAVRDFERSGVISKDDKPRLRSLSHDIEILRKKWLPEIICMLLAITLAVMTIEPEFVSGSSIHGWHTFKDAHGMIWLTRAGSWEMLVALPLQNYWWMRWVWKITLWFWYLSRLSKFHLVLVASHPDRTGGISFLSEVQARFAFVILAYGISSVVATVGYKLAIEHASITLPPVWGPVVGFVIGAPLLFLSPLLLFTKQLYRTKKRAVEQFREKAMASALKVEEQWLHSQDDRESESGLRAELSQLNLLTGFYDRITTMRVVPFDLSSMSQLIGSAVAPVFPLLPYFISIPEPWQKSFEAMGKWFGH